MQNPFFALMKCFPPIGGNAVVGRTIYQPNVTRPQQTFHNSDPSERKIKEFQPLVQKVKLFIVEFRPVDLSTLHRKSVDWRKSGST